MFICSSSVFSTFRCLEKQDKFLILFTSSRLFTQGMYIIYVYCTPHTGTYTQPCLTLLLLMDCSPPGSSVHGIVQARTLMWVAILLQGIFRDRLCVSCVSYISRWIPYNWATWEAHTIQYTILLVVRNIQLEIMQKVSNVDTLNTIFLYYIC